MPAQKRFATVLLQLIRPFKKAGCKTPDRPRSKSYRVVRRATRTEGNAAGGPFSAVGRLPALRRHALALGAQTCDSAAVPVRQEPFAQRRFDRGRIPQGAQPCLNAYLAGEHLHEVRKQSLAKPFPGAVSRSALKVNSLPGTLSILFTRFNAGSSNEKWGIEWQA